MSSFFGRSRLSKRDRLRDSPINGSELERVFERWFKRTGTRLIDRLLEDVLLCWSRGAMPEAADLANEKILSLIEILAQDDPTVHPRVALAADVMVTCHRKQENKPCFTKARADIEAGKYSRVMLLACYKYRCLVQYPEKYKAAMSKVFFFFVLLPLEFAPQIIVDKKKRLAQCLEYCRKIKKVLQHVLKLYTQNNVLQNVLNIVVELI